jgi:hypothetical protein
MKQRELNARHITFLTRLLQGIPLPQLLMAVLRHSLKVSLEAARALCIVQHRETLQIATPESQADGVVGRMNPRADLVTSQC